MSKPFLLNEAHELPRTTKSEQRRRRDGKPPSKDQQIRDLEHKVKQLEAKIQDMDSTWGDLTDKLGTANEKLVSIAEEGMETQAENDRLRKQIERERLARQQERDQSAFLIEEARVVSKFWKSNMLEGRKVRNQEDFRQAQKDPVFGALWRAKLNGNKLTQEDFEALQSNETTLEDLSKAAFDMGFRVRFDSPDSGVILEKRES